jgi:hypothetical protein
MITEQQIKELAFAIWEQEGRPAGKDAEHYFRAKQILEAKEAARIIELAPQTPPIELASPPEKKNKKSTRNKKR